MKRFALMAFLAVVVAESADVVKILPDPGTQKICTKALKCRKEDDKPYAVVRGRCCTTFNNNCEYFAYEQLYQPSFTAALSNPSECTCVVGKKFLVSPEDDKCKYERDPLALCLAVECNENEFKPVHANGPCGCKIFKNRCFFNQFNCAHKTKFVETTELAGCICRYEPRFTIDPIYPDPVIPIDPVYPEPVIA